MKKLLLLFILIFFIGSAIAEEIPPQGVVMTKESYPIFWSYMEDYAEALQKAFEAKRIWHLRGMGSSCELIISRNGEIKEIKTDIFQNDYFDEKVKEVILSVPPKPFYDGMNAEDMLFRVYLGYEHYDEKELSVGYHGRFKRKIFHVTLVLNK